MPGTLTVNTANNIAGGVDQYGAIAQNGSLDLELFLQDATGTALAGKALPLLPPALASFGFRQFRLFSDDAQFLGSVDSLVCTSGCSGQSVAEPGSLLLMSLALASLLRIRVRRANA